MANQVFYLILGGILSQTLEEFRQVFLAIEM